MRRVLITGGGGQVGNALIASAPPESQIYAPDSSSCDISNPESVQDTFSSFEPELVINAAAYTAVDRAETDRRAAFEVNAEGAGNLARACRVDQTPLIHLSTDYVFDGTGKSAYNEDETTNPLNVYGASKLAGELQIIEAGTPYLILRVSWVFSATRSNFVKTMLGLAGRDTLRVVDDQRGTPCSADDIAEALWLSAERLEMKSARLLLHFSSTPSTTWFGFAKTIFETAASLGIVGRIPHLEPISSDGYPAAARRPANSLLDSSRLQRVVGFQPPDWRDSLRDVLRELTV